MDTLKKIIKDLKKKPCFLDPAPISVLNNVFDLLYPLFLQMVNSTITESYFPDLLKFASVSPKIKDPKLDPNNFQHLRPISSLPFLSKIIESTIYIQLDEHLTSHGLYPTNQSAYRRNHSCETTLTKLMNDTQNLNSNGKNVVVMLLDQSAAFDTVNHGTLKIKLQEIFNIRGKALELIDSYFTHRTFSIKIGQHLSSPRKLRYGVPQGSLLGPLFYNLYTADIENIFSKYDINFHCYADDTQVLCSFGDEESRVKMKRTCVTSA